MFTGRIIKRAFQLGNKKQEKQEEDWFCNKFLGLLEKQKTFGEISRKSIKDKETCLKFCDSFQDLMEQQKTLGEIFRKAIKDEEPCLQMPDIVYEFVGKTGRRFAVYRSDPPAQNALENGEEIDRLGFERYLAEDNSSLIDLQKKEFDGISLKEILEKAKENDDTFDKSRMASLILFVVSKNKSLQFFDNPSLYESNEESEDTYGPGGAFFSEDILQVNIYNLMEVPFWYNFK